MYESSRNTEGISELEEKDIPSAIEYAAWLAGKYYYPYHLY